VVGLGRDAAVVPVCGFVVVLAPTVVLVTALGAVVGGTPVPTRTLFGSMS
jgi:hypothetical protein